MRNDTTRRLEYKSENKCKASSIPSRTPTHPVATPLERQAEPESKHPPFKTKSSPSSCLSLLERPRYLLLPHQDSSDAGCSAAHRAFPTPPSSANPSLELATPHARSPSRRRRVGEGGRTSIRPQASFIHLLLVSAHWFDCM